jgi:phage-related holin
MQNFVGREGWSSGMTSGVWLGLKVALCTLAATWLGLAGALRLLVIMQLLDAGGGMLVAAYSKDAKHKLSRQTAWRGVIKKVMAWLLVLAVNALQTQLKFPEVIAGFTPAEVTATFFAVAVEGVSLVEKAYLVGLPVPPFIVGWLKIAQDQFATPLPVQKNKKEKNV